MKKLLFYLSVVLLFTGCTVNKPTFNLMDKAEILGSKVIDSKNFTLSSIDIKQNKLKNNNNRILFYEEVSTWDDYEFRDTTLNNIMYIFNAKSATVLYNDNTTLLVQIELILGEFLNVIAYSNNMENLSYAYGLSNYEFKKIAKEIIKDSKIRLPSLKKQGIGVRIDDMPLSRWSETKLIVKPFTVFSNGRTLF